jgi:hypothetical protein
LTYLNLKQIILATCLQATLHTPSTSSRFTHRLPPAFSPPLTCTSLFLLTNAQVVNERDAAALPVPQHVALDHLYCTAIKDGMMVLGVTERYRTKFFSTVYYSMMP